MGSKGVAPLDHTLKIITSFLDTFSTDLDKLESDLGKNCGICLHWRLWLHHCISPCLFAIWVLLSEGKLVSGYCLLCIAFFECSLHRDVIS